MNNHTITGRIGQVREPHRFPDGGMSLSFTVATERGVKKGDRWENETDWHNVNLGGKRAAALERHLVKGLYVSVSGPSVTRKYTARDGQERSITEIRAKEVTICWPPKNGGARAPAAPNEQTNAFANEDDIPF